MATNKIGEKLKKVFQNLGTKFTILRESGAISGEYLDEESNAQVTKPFVREFFRECTLPYDTQTVPGDLIKYEVDELDDDQTEYFLVVHHDYEKFRNTPITVSAVLYKTNVICDIYRPSGEMDPHTYQTITHWNLLKASQRCLLTDKLYGTRLDDNEQFFMQSDIQSLIAYAPKSLQIAPHDRFIVSGELHYGGGVSGEQYYAVKYLERNQFRGVDLVYLEEDTRS